MRIHLAAIAAFAITIVGASSSGLAASLSLPATHDVYIGGSTAANSGPGGVGTEAGSNTNGAGHYVGQSSRRSIFQFDLSQIPANSTINNAYLRLYLSDASGDNNYTILGRIYSDAAGTVTIDETSLITSSEPAITVANPDIGDFPALSGAGSSLVKEQYYNSEPASLADLELLQNIYEAGGSFLLGVYATGSGTSGFNNRNFADREGNTPTSNPLLDLDGDFYVDGGTTFYPLLVVEYTSIPEPNTTVLICIGSLAVCLAYRRLRKI